MKGYFSVDDENKVVNDAISGKNAFTVSSRVYVPASVKSTDTGVWDKDNPHEKHNMIASMGDNSFAYRIYYDKNRKDIHIDAFIVMEVHGCRQRQDSFRVISLINGTHYPYLMMVKH